MRNIKALKEGRFSRWIPPIGFALLLASLQSAAGQQQASLETIQSGVSLADHGNPDAAIALLSTVAEKQPQNPAIHDAIGAAYLIKLDYRTAETYFERSLSIEPGFAPARQNLGIALYSQARYDEAAYQFGALVQSGSTNNQDVAILFLGLIAFQKNDYATACKLLVLSKKLESSPEALLALADASLRRGETGEAGRALQRFDALNATDAAQRSRAALLRNELQQGNEQPRTESVSSVSGSGGVDSYTRASELYSHHRLIEARKILDSMSVNQPSADVFMLLADVAKDQGDVAVAMKSLKQAAKLDPSREEAYLEFSELCSEHGNDQLGLDSADIGLANIPGSYRLLVQKASALDKLGRLEEAETALRSAALKQDDDSVALLSLGIVLAHGGRLKEAEETLQEAILKAPRSGYTHYYRGRILLQLASATSSSVELREEARREFERAIQTDASHADFYYQLSTVYDPSQAQLIQAALKQCLKLEPGHTAGKYALARLYIRTGRRAQGEEILARFKEEQRAAELKQNKQLRIEVASK